MGRTQCHNQGDALKGPPMSDISVSERRLSAALDRIDQFLETYLDRGAATLL